MIEYLKRLLSPPQKKESQVGRLMVMHQLGQPKMSKRDLETLSKEGYMKAVVVFRCVNLVADSFASIPLMLMRQRKKVIEPVDDHPLLDLLDRPSDMVSGVSFRKQLAAWYVLTGNTFIEGAFDGKRIPRYLYAQNPRLFQIFPGANGMPAKYRATNGSDNRDFPVSISGDCDVKHIKTFNPVDPWWGMSPLEAASTETDILNASALWNLSLLQNGGVPSGVFELVGSPENPQTLTPDQHNQLRQMIEDQQSGPYNRGRPLLLDGGLKYTPTGLSPVDIDFVEGRKTTKGDVALAFGVPGQLVGLEDSQKFENYRQARLAFYEDTVLPIHEKILTELNNWLIPLYGDDSLFLKADLDAVPALEPKREALWDRVNASTFMTYDEKREMLDLPEYDGTNDKPGSKILVPAGLIPLEMAVDDLLDDEPLTDTEDLTGPQDDESEETPPSTPPADDLDDDGETNDDGTKSMTCIEGKMLNVTSTRAKRRAYLSINRKRARFEKRFQAQVAGFFRQQGKELAESLEGADYDLIDSITTVVISKTEQKLADVMRANIMAIGRSFSRDVFDLAGKSRRMVETKDEADEWDQAYNDYVETHVGERIKRIAEVTRTRVVKKLKSLIIEAQETGETIDDLAKKVEEIFKDMTKTRALTIARTETHNASSKATLQAAEALKDVIEEKEWVPFVDSRTRRTPESEANHAAMKNKRVALHQKFEVPTKSGADLMDGPGDMNAPAYQTINCRCVLIFTTRE